MDRTTTYPSKLRIYAHGAVEGSVGAYAYIIVENRSCGILDIDGVKGRMFAPSEAKSQFSQAGKTDSDVRMQMRAVYEGLRHCPDNSEVVIFSDYFILKEVFEMTKAKDEDGDVAEKYRSWVRDHNIKPVYALTRRIEDRVSVFNDHDEWVLAARELCSESIKKYKK